MSMPPKYELLPADSQLDPFREQIAAMLAEDPKVASTVITERLRRFGFVGSVTIVKDHVRQVRPSILAALSFQSLSRNGQLCGKGLAGFSLSVVCENPEGRSRDRGTQRRQYRPAAGRLPAR